MKHKIYRYSFSFFLLLISFMLVNCDATKLEILDNPNRISEEDADADFYLNAIQLNFNDFFEDVTEQGMEITRMKHMLGPTYPEAYNSATFNDAWREAYSSIFIDVKKLDAVAREQGLYLHIGISQVLKAYTAATLVDYFGDVPYSEATQGSKFYNPKKDSGADIYVELYKLLDKAIVNLNKNVKIKPKNDLFYGKNGEKKWVKLANTLKIKLYLQSSLVNKDLSKTEINKIISSGNYIKNSSDDFKFNYGINVSGPDSRHPFFSENFKGSGGVADYMSNYYMDLLLNSYDIPDPRVRYYFYRQNKTNATSQVQQTCFETLRPSHYSFDEIYCNLGGNPGYWGRDHGNENGTPPDGDLRATWGLYPVGGNFDADNFKSISSTLISTKGAGIQPIMMSSFVDFMLAEATLTLGTIGNSEAYLKNGIDKSMATVIGFRKDLVDKSFAPNNVTINDYTNKVIESYKKAQNNDSKLNIIVKQYFIALWGNGVEAFNTFRRTGKPSDVQPLVRSEVTKCLRSFLYPQDYINNNSNANQKSDVYQKVFWDTNPDDKFIK